MGRKIIQNVERRQQIAEMNRREAEREAQLLAARPGAVRWVGFDEGRDDRTDAFGYTPGALKPWAIITEDDPMYAILMARHSEVVHMDRPKDEPAKMEARYAERAASCMAAAEPSPLARPMEPPIDCHTLDNLQGQIARLSDDKRHLQRKLNEQDETIRRLRLAEQNQREAGQTRYKELQSIASALGLQNEADCARDVLPAIADMKAGAQGNTIMYTMICQALGVPQGQAAILPAIEALKARATSEHDYRPDKFDPLGQRTLAEKYADVQAQWSQLRHEFDAYKADSTRRAAENATRAQQQLEQIGAALGVEFPNVFPDQIVLAIQEFQVRSDALKAAWAAMPEFHNGVKLAECVNLATAIGILKSNPALSATLTAEQFKERILRELDGQLQECRVAHTRAVQQGDRDARIDAGGRLSELAMTKSFINRLPT